VLFGLLPRRIPRIGTEGVPLNCEVDMDANMPVTGFKKRILLVDDDEDTRIMMGVLLSEYGYEPILATSVSDALEYARSGGLALCILDHWITQSKGTELCQQIRTFDSLTPILFYSGAGYKTDITSGLDAGAQAYIVKPDFAALMKTITGLVDQTDSKATDYHNQRPTQVPTASSDSSRA
jgi:DNA-binding response OmpR family regulator